MVPNAWKWYGRHQNMSLGSNGVDWVRSLRKVPTWLRGTYFCINCTSSHCFAPSFMQLGNDNRWTQTQWNLWKYELGSNGVDWVCSLRKIPTWLRGTNFCINCTSSPCLHRVWCSYKSIPNAPKHYATHKNMSLRSNGADWVRSLRKIPMWHHGTNFCINCTSSPRFAPSFMQLWNHPKCT